MAVALCAFVCNENLWVVISQLLELVAGRGLQRRGRVPAKLVVVTGALLTYVGRAAGASDDVAPRPRKVNAMQSLNGRSQQSQERVNKRAVHANGCARTSQLQIAQTTRMIINCQWLEVQESQTELAEELREVVGSTSSSLPAGWWHSPASQLPDQMPDQPRPLINQQTVSAWWLAVKVQPPAPAQPLRGPVSSVSPLTTGTCLHSAGKPNTGKPARQCPVIR